MTKRRQFLNKINKRIQTLSKRAGVDIEQLYDKFADMDGVFITDSGNLNIDPSVFTPQLESRIEKLIPTYLEEATSAAEQIESNMKYDFIGPPNLTEANINRVIRTKYDFEYDFERFKEKFYNFTDAQDALDLAGNANWDKINSTMRSMGHDWATEPNFAELADTLNALEQLELK